MREDPIGLKRDINLYLYALNNPLMNIDLFGLETTTATTVPGGPPKGKPICIKCDWDDLAKCTRDALFGQINNAKCYECGICLAFCARTGNCGACYQPCLECMPIAEVPECYYEHCDIGHWDPECKKCEY